MDYENDELARRRQRREELKKKRLAEQRRTLVGLIIGAVVLIGCGIGLFALSRKDGGETAQTKPPRQTTTATTTTAPAPVTEPEQPQDATTVIHLAACGDLNVTDNSVAAGLTSGGYDYSDVFREVTPLIADADMAFLNFEGNLVGAPYGSKQLSAPPQLIQALANCGFDMLQMANSCAIRNGLSGLRQTLDGIRAGGLEPVGAYATEDEFEEAGGYLVMEVRGIRIAFVAFTKGMDNMALPVGSEHCVNLLYTDYASTYQEVDTDRILEVLKNAEKAEADLTIALLHWGSEYNDTISATQKQITRLMLENGVDAIIGTHPHYVHQVDFNKEAGTLVAYSLGDFYGEADKAGTNYSIVLDIEITRDNTTGVTRITGFSYTPIYTIKGDDAGGKMRVVQLEEAIRSYEEGFLGRVSQSTYDDMVYSMMRIEARVNGE